MHQWLTIHLSMPRLACQGYGWTLGTINALAVLASAFQATPPLGLQVVSILLWMVARFFMYSR